MCTHACKSPHFCIRAFSLWIQLMVPLLLLPQRSCNSSNISPELNPQTKPQTRTRCLPLPPSPPNTSQRICSSPLSLQATFKGWMDIMYAAVDSREVRGQAGMSHNRHQGSLVPPSRFPRQAGSRVLGPRRCSARAGDGPLGRSNPPGSAHRGCPHPTLGFS